MTFLVDLTYSDQFEKCFFSKISSKFSFENKLINMALKSIKVVVSEFEIVRGRKVKSIAEYIGCRIIL